MMLNRVPVLTGKVMPVKYFTRMSSIFSRSVHVLFKKNLLLTNTVTSGAFMAIGDLIQQEFEYRTKKRSTRNDWARAGRMFIVGALSGPLHHYYYITLDKVLPKANFKTVLTKVALDQLFCAPATILCFFFGMGLLEKKSTTDIQEEIKDKFKYVYMGDCLFWPPIQFINFYYLPTRYRVVYINAATMVFDIFLSFMKHDF